MELTEHNAIKIFLKRKLAIKAQITPSKLERKEALVKQLRGRQEFWLLICPNSSLHAPLPLPFVLLLS